ncbi:MAG TPA: PilZ domain-containing protein [Phycisphaerae bacterium]|nr:PilZ domain-containing protein [Phycisphaerae bacterium]HRW53036.1 PilZ domain-containing protein [Phycisphaerae bacterium]
MDAGRLKNLNSIERRRDTRRWAHGSVMMSVDGVTTEFPGQLVDVSGSGIGVLTTDKNAPILGEHIDVCYVDRRTDEDGASECHQKGIVVNIRHPERGVSRIGVRFFQGNGEGCLRGEPDDSLDMLKQGASAPSAGQNIDPWAIPASYEACGAN